MSPTRTAHILTLTLALVLTGAAVPQGAATTGMTALVEDAASTVRLYALGTELSPAEAEILVQEVHPLMSEVRICYAESDGFAYPANLRFTDACAARLAAPLENALARLHSARLEAAAVGVAVAAIQPVRG